MLLGDREKGVAGCFSMPFKQEGLLRAQSDGPWLWAAGGDSRMQLLRWCVGVGRIDKCENKNGG